MTQSDEPLLHAGETHLGRDDDAPADHTEPVVKVNRSRVAMPSFSALQLNFTTKGHLRDSPTAIRNPPVLTQVSILIIRLIANS